MTCSIRLFKWWNGGFCKRCGHAFDDHVPKDCVACTRLTAAGEKV